MNIALQHFAAHLSIRLPLLRLALQKLINVVYHSQKTFPRQSRDQKIFLSVLIKVETKRSTISYHPHKKDLRVVQSIICSFSKNFLEIEICHNWNLVTKFLVTTHN